MTVEIIQIKEQEKYEVNGKLIYKNQFGDWQWHDELLEKEKEVFRKLVASRFKNSNLKKKF